MSSISFPYTSVGGDRKVTAFQEAQGFNLFVGSGVVEPTAGALGTALEVSAVPDTMNVSVAEGSAINIGHRYIQTGATVLTLDAGGTLDRIDVIAVESNRLNAVRAAQLVVIKGTEGAAPEAPALTVTDTQYQVALAWVTVPASCTTLNAATVTDKRVASRPRGISSEAQAVIDKHAYKLPVIVATTENITLSGEQTIDGVAVVATNRVLVKNQTDAGDNGIYVASASAWVRANDFDSDADAVSQSLISVESGTAGAATTWRLSTVSPIVLGTTDLTFVQFDTDSVTAGNGLVRVLDEVSMRTPGSITLSTTNKADGTDHTHALTLPGLTPLTTTSSTTNTISGSGHSHAWTIPADMAALTFVYRATGTADGAAISALVNAFLDASGAWNGTTERALKLLITGTLGLPATPPYGTGEVGDPFRHFNFTSTQTRGAIVEIDWSDARGLAYTAAGEYARLILQTGVGARLKHSGLTAKLDGYGECEIIAVMAGAEAWLTGGRLQCEYNGYSDYFYTVVVSASRAAMTGVQMTGTVYAMPSSVVLMDDCFIEISSSAATQFSAVNGIHVASGQVRISNSYVSVYSHFTGASGYAHAKGFYISSGQLSAVNCIVEARAECDSELDAIAAACHVNASTVQASALLNSCKLLAYEKSAGASSTAYAIHAGSDTQNAVIAIGNTFPTVALSGYAQTGAVLLEGTTEGSAYFITGNAFGEADAGANVVKHSDSDPAANYYMANNMFSLTLV